MAIKFVDKEPGEGEPKAKPAKREALGPIEGDSPTERPGASPLPHAKPPPKKRGRN